MRLSLKNFHITRFGFLMQSTGLEKIQRSQNQPAKAVLAQRRQEEGKQKHFNIS